MSRKRRHSSSDEEENFEASNDHSAKNSPSFEQDSEQEDPEEISVSGKIELITLVNFLCHSHLQVPLGPNVNFIIGSNGSGKSAIMTGVVVALGGRASQTSRGLSLKNFVKKGCSYGQVSVQLRNVAGADSYRHNVYGDSIIIERKITADGGSFYKVKSSEGKVVSTNRIEVDHIVDHFNIQVDNPVSLLNQDTSRHLLNSNDGCDLYKFFMKATNLEQITTDYYFVMEQKDIALATLEKKEQDIPDVREEVRRHEARFIAVKQMKDIKEQIEQLKTERIWAEVIEHEKEVSKLEAALEKLRSGLPKYDKKIKESEEKVSEIEEQVRAAEHAVNQLTAEAQSLQDKQKEIVMKLQERKKTLKEKQSAMKRLQREIEDVSRNQTVLQEKIDEIKSSVGNIEEEHRQKNLLLEQKRKDLEKLQCDLQGLHKRTTELHSEEKQNKEEVAEISQEEETVRKEIKEKQRRVQQAKNKADSRLLKFGDWMPNLVNRIQAAVREGRFIKPPRGPIGLHVQVKDQKWSKAVETCLRNLAYGFCVANHQDLKVLKTITARTCTNFFPVMLVCPFQETIYDVSSNKPNCQFPTVLDMVNIDDHVIANCLIDQLHIETTLLIENRSLACNVIWSRQAPAKQAFAASGDLIVGGGCAKSTAPPKETRNYLSSNTIDDVRTLNQEISLRSEAIRQLKERKREREACLRQTSGELAQAEKSKKKMRDSVNNLKLEIDELMEGVEEEVLPDISELEADLEHYTQQLEDLCGQSQNAEQELAEAKRLMVEEEKVNDEHRRRVSEVLANAEPKKEKLESLIRKSDQEKKNKEHFEEERGTLEEKIDQNEREKEGLVKLAQQKAEQASEHFERVETTRSVVNLETEIIKKQRYIDEEERNRGSAEKIIKEFKDVADRFADILQNKTNVKKYNKYFTKTMERRMSYIDEKRKILASNTSQFFTRHLSQRGFSGYIKFDHNRESLELIVNVHRGPNDVHSNKNHMNGSTSVMKSLSGGERSVSTICFLTALWGAMESPFRCLDEFDVFLDLMNRKIVMKMVLELAMLPDQKNRQFIFLTPLDLSALPIDKQMVKILKLDNPAR